MRRLAGCVALAIVLSCGPLAAEEEGPVAARAADPAASSKAPSSGTLELAALPLLEQLPPPPPPPITLVLNTDLAAQRLTVTENGKVKHVWPISSGRPGYATQTGTFRPQWASKMWYSRQYEYAPMPHAIFFHRGTAFHATGAVGLLGRPASHGCVRLAPGNAALLFKLVHKHGYAQTKVVVHKGARDRGPAIASKGDRGRKTVNQPGQRRDARVSRYNAGYRAY